MIPTRDDGEFLDAGSEDDAAGVGDLHLGVRDDQVFGHHREHGGVVVGEQEVARGDESLDRPTLGDWKPLVAGGVDHALGDRRHRLVGIDGRDIPGHVLADGRLSGHSFE